MMKHKWHDEIVAWAGGAEIEFKNSFDPTISGWQTVANPDWIGLEFKFRIKPQPKQPKYLYVVRNHDGLELSEYIDNSIYKIEVQE